MLFTGHMVRQGRRVMCDVKLFELTKEGGQEEQKI